MGYFDNIYRSRKEEMHELMARAVAGTPIVRHNFHFSEALGNRFNHRDLPDRLAFCVLHGFQLARPKQDHPENERSSQGR